MVAILKRGHSNLAELSHNFNHTAKNTVKRKETAAESIGEKPRLPSSTGLLPIASLLKEKADGADKGDQTKEPATEKT